MTSQLNGELEHFPQKNQNYATVISTNFCVKGFNNFQRCDKLTWALASLKTNPILAEGFILEQLKTPDETIWTEPLPCRFTKWFPMK